MDDEIPRSPNGVSVICTVFTSQFKVLLDRFVLCVILIPVQFIHLERNDSEFMEDHDGRPELAT